MTRFPVRALLALLACIASAVSLTSAPATGQSVTVRSPHVVAVTPLAVSIGDRLTIRGSGFISGRKRNTVVFKRDGQRAIFVKADRATPTSLTVVVPDKLAPFLVSKAGTPQATTFRIRVLARRLAKTFTPLSRSPKIAPAAVTPPPAAPVATGTIAAAPEVPPADCDDDKTPDDADLDDDNDHVADSAEAAFGTERCKADTDGDGLEDHFELQSALDLNGRASFGPVKRPWPNPRYFGDADLDFDQDGLTARVEHDLWVREGRQVEMTYSDGDQSTTTAGDPIDQDNDGFNRLVEDGVTDHLDLDGDGVLSDDERDLDQDGLTNWDEFRGRMVGQWWGTKYKSELPFFNVADVILTDAAEVNSGPGEPMWADPDVDGDRRPDGQDDQDHDGWSNAEELWRGSAHPRRTGPVFDVDADGDDDDLMGNPFNPCLPDRNSRVCTLHPPVDGGWAPFNPMLPVFEIPAAGDPAGTRVQELVTWPARDPAPVPGA